VFILDAVTMQPRCNPQVMILPSIIDIDQKDNVTLLTMYL